MKRKRRALVLAGGGAKGAYAFGCMQAFKEAGIEFEQVSGTSVGALNAFLWSTNSMEEGKELYENLSFPSIYPINLFRFRIIGKWYLMFAAIIYIFPRMLWKSLGRAALPGTHFFAMITGILGLLIMIWLNFYMKRIDPDFTSLNFWTIISIIFYLRYQIIEPYTSKSRKWARVLLTWYCGIFFVKIVFILYSLNHIAWYLKVLYSILIFSSSRIVMSLVIGLVMIIFDLIFFSDNVSLLSSKPLVQKLETLLQNKDLQIPTCVTLACERQIFDPDNPGWYYKESPFIFDPNKDEPKLPNIEKKWCPHYFQIDKMDKEYAGLFCAASAALPYGLVKPLKVGDDYYVDGGIVDNCPILPLTATEEDFDELFVVLLSSFKSDAEAIKSNGLHLENCRALRRLVDLSTFPIPTDDKLKNVYVETNSPPIHVPYRQIKDLPPLCLFYPKEDLGGWFSGTLNFSGKYAKRIMKQGYSDSLIKLQQLGIVSLNQ